MTSSHLRLRPANRRVPRKASQSGGAVRGRLLGFVGTSAIGCACALGAVGCLSGENSLPITYGPEAGLDGGLPNHNADGSVDGQSVDAADSAIDASPMDAGPVDAAINVGPTG